MSTTTQRGLGADHQRERKRQIAALRDGEPCWRCGRPMFRAMAAFLDLDHVVPRCMGGAQGVRRLTHRACNRRAGQVIGAVRQAGRRRSRASRW